MTHLFFAVIAILAVTVVPGFARAASDQHELVVKAEATFKNFEYDSNMKWFQRKLGEAKAILIAPEIL